MIPTQQEIDANKVIETLQNRRIESVEAWVIRFRDGSFYCTRSGKSVWTKKRYASCALTYDLYGRTKGTSFKNNKELSHYLIDNGHLTIERLA